MTSDFGSVLAVDLNQDGRLDLLLSGAEINFALNNGDGTFQKSAAYFGGTISSYAVSADFNGDGEPDFATFDVLSGDLVVIFGIK